MKLKDIKNKTGVKKALIAFCICSLSVALFKTPSLCQSISGATSTCVGISTTYTFIGTYAGTLTWKVVGGSFSQSGSSIYVTWNTQTNFGKVEASAVLDGELKARSIILPVVVYPNGGTLGGGTISAPASTCFNTPVTLSNVTSATGGGFSRYTWYKRGESENWPTPINDLNSAITSSNLTERTYFYREASFQCGKVQSNTVIIDVVPPVSPGSIVGPGTLCHAVRYGTVTSTAPASGGTGTFAYQWQESVTGADPWFDINGATEPNYYITNLQSPTWFRRKVTSCSSSSTTSVFVQIAPPVIAGSVSGGGHFCESSIPSVTVTGTPASGGLNAYTYEWRRMNELGGWDAVSGATGINLTTNAAGSYRRADTGCGETKLTNTIVISADATSLGGDLTGSYEACVFASAGGPVPRLMVTGWRGNILRWEFRRQSAAEWITIPTIESFYEYQNVKETTHYRTVVKNGLCPEAASASATITIYPKPVIQFDGGSPSLPVTGTLQAQTEQSYASYQWLEKGTAIPNATTRSISINKPGKFQVRVKGSNAMTQECLSDEITVGTLANQAGVNLVSTISIRKSGISNADEIYGQLQQNEFTQILDYQDGLGRTQQVIGLGQSPTNSDIVQPAAYDRFGNATKVYLPYATASLTDAFKQNALVDQLQFYQGTSKIANSTAPYAQTVFDNSPLNRVLKQGAPGTDWQPTGLATNLNDKTIKSQYTFNTANEVLLITYNQSAGSISSGTGGQSSYYPANDLYVITTYDENNVVSKIYKDKDGKVVLKRVQRGKDSLNNILFSSTYYVYDEQGRLVIIIPPEALNQMGTLFNQN